MRRGNPHKVKAYTILEVVIAMLVSVVVIFITYTAYSIVSRSYGNFRSKNEDMAILARLDQLLLRDFERAEVINGSGNQVSMTRDNGRMVSYEFANGYVVRTDQIVDTFKVSTEKYQTLFEGKPLGDGEELDVKNKESDRLDELSFAVTYKNETIPYHYYKRYSSLNLINRNPHAIN